MVHLYDAERGTRLGTITDEQLQFLISELEEESRTDQDYYLSAGTVAMLEENGADAALVELLRRALGAREGLEVRWARE